nr:MAG TPA: hypothetical protein [Caudoviricetes sp.]
MPLIPGVPEEGVTIIAGAFEKTFGNVTLNSVIAFDLQSINGVRPDCGKSDFVANVYKSVQVPSLYVVVLTVSFSTLR